MPHKKSKLGQNLKKSLFKKIKLGYLISNNKIYCNMKEMASVRIKILFKYKNLIMS